MDRYQGLTYIEKEKLLLAFDDQKPEMKQYDIYKIQEVNKININIIPKQAIIVNNQRLMAFLNEKEILMYDLFDMKIIQLIQYGFDKERTLVLMINHQFLVDMMVLMNQKQQLNLLKENLKRKLLIKIGKKENNILKIRIGRQSRNYIIIKGFN